MSRRGSSRALVRQSRAGKAAPVALPLAPQLMWRLLIGGFAILGTTAATVWAIAAKVPEQATMAFATATSSAGFVVRQVDITGMVNQSRLSIYREVLEGGSDSMLLADLPAMRERLIALPWVRDANVRRRWPDRLEVRIIERKPAALWQHQGRLRLVDAEGVLLPATDLSDFAHLPLLVGADAREHAPAILKLIASQPAIASDMEAAIWIGQRRWDIRMKSGETISLPEGTAAQGALMRFAQIHRETPLLGRGFVRFDFRIPEKMVVRVSGEAGSVARPNPAPPRPAPEPVPPRTAPEPVPSRTAPVPALAPESAPAAIPMTGNELARSPDERQEVTI